MARISAPSAKLGLLCIEFRIHAFFVLIINMTSRAYLYRF